MGNEGDGAGVMKGILRIYQFLLKYMELLLAEMLRGSFFCLYLQISSPFNSLLQHPRPTTFMCLLRIVKYMEENKMSEHQRYFFNDMGRWEAAASVFIHEEVSA